MSKEASKNMKKRLVALIGAVLMIATTMGGCTKMDPEQTIATVGGVEIKLDLANFYARYQQTQIETLYGSSMGGADMWRQPQGDGITYENAMKESILDNLIMMHILETKQKEYAISLSEEEKAKITEATQEFLNANEEATKEVISANADTVERVLTLLTIETKMRTAMIADVDTEVADSEAAQKRMEYVHFAFSSTDEEGVTTVVEEDGKADFKATAEQFAKEAATVEDFAALAEEYEQIIREETFDSDSVRIEAALLTEVDALAEGEVSELVETEEGYYVARLASLLDREATDARKESIVLTRQNERYQELCEAWMEEADVQRDDRAWRSISFVRQGVTTKVEEPEIDEPEEDTTTLDSPATTEEASEENAQADNEDVEAGDVAEDVAEVEEETQDTNNAESEEVETEAETEE